MSTPDDNHRPILVEESHGSETITLTEWGESQPLSLTEADISFIEQQINADAKKLGIEYTGEGLVVLSSSRHVGIVALPDGPTIEIVPKSAGNNFVWLLQYANGVDVQTVQHRTDVQRGTAFLDALAALFVDEVGSILQQGLAQAYHREQETEKFLRGQLDVQRQLQTQGPTATEFEVGYDELTADITANQGVLYASVLLKRLTTDRRLRQRLDQQITRLRREISLRQIRPHELADIEVTRLNGYYRDALRLAELIIRNVYIEELREGDRGSYGLLINMDKIFEAVVERSFRDAIEKTEAWNGWRVVGQANVTGLVTGGTPRVQMHPDFIVRNVEDEVVFTGDAKWKTGTVRQDDIYQLTAYQLADDVPGVLVYPEQDGEVETEYTVRGSYPMAVHELPTSTEVEDFAEFCTLLTDNTKSLLRDLI